MVVNICHVVLDANMSEKGRSDGCHGKGHRALFAHERNSVG